MTGGPNRPGAPSDDDPFVTLRVRKSIRNAIRRIAAFEEITMEALTASSLESTIAKYKSKIGIPLLRRPTSARPKDR